MSMKKEIKGTYMIWLYIVLILSQIVLLYALATESIKIESLFSRAVLVLGVILYAISYIYEDKINSRDMIFFLIMLLFCIVGVAHNWKFDNIVKFAGFALMLSVWRTGRNIITRRGVQKVVCLVYAIQGLMLIALYFSPYAYESYQEYVEISNELTLGFGNPNQTGIILSSTIIILLLTMGKNAIEIQWRRLLLIEVVVLSVLLLLTHARTAILSCSVFVAFFLLAKKKMSERKRYFLADAVICFPIVFISTYIQLANSTLENITLFGKPIFSGRDALYQSAIRRWDNKAFGDLWRFNFDNFHNSHLTILVNLGIIGFFLYLIYTISEFNYAYKKCKTSHQVLCIIAVLTIFIAGCAEAAGLVGGSIYYVYYLTIVLLANEYDKEDAVRG